MALELGQTGHDGAHQFAARGAEIPQCQRGGTTQKPIRFDWAIRRLQLGGPAMRLLTLLAFGWLIANVPTVMAQGTGAGGGSSSGGSPRGGGGTAGPATTAPSTAAPGVGNTQVDPGRK